MTITLGTYNDTLIKADNTGYFSLTDMWKANGGKRTQAPFEWKRLPDTQKLLEVLEKEVKAGLSRNDLMRTQRGGAMPGTWGLQKVAIAYAEYLSPEFHAWVLDAVSAFVHMEENPEVGLSRYAEQSIKALKKAGRSDTYIMERIEGIAIRKMMDSEARIAGVNNEGMATLSTNINEPGLYSLVLRSREPDAKAFKRWIAHEGIPTISKTGYYNETLIKADDNGYYSLTDMERQGGLRSHRVPVEGEWSTRKEQTCPLVKDRSSQTTY